MPYYDTGGLNLWEILGLAILFIWAINRYFRKRNEEADEGAGMFPMDQGVTEEFDHIKDMEDDFNRQHDDWIIDDMLERRRRDLFRNI